MVGTDIPHGPNFESIEDDESSTIEDETAAAPFTAGFVRISLSTAKLHSVAQRLYDQACLAEQKQGINVLYAVFGFLNWQEDSGKNAE